MTLGEEGEGLPSRDRGESRGRVQGFRLSLGLAVGGWSWERELGLGPGCGRGPVVLGILGVSLAIFLVGAVGALAVRGSQVPALEAEVARLEAEGERLDELETLLVEVEDAYAVLRSLFEPAARPGRTGTIQLPVPATAGGGGVSGADGEGGLPTTWPLTTPGFLTQPLVEGAGVDHPGIDVAAPAGSYIRSAGPGRVLEAAEDPVYGLYVVVDHGDGYRSLYAHASLLFVDPGQEVFRGEVIALTGSTGRSTAPHLHFEILRDGEPLDPLSLVRRP